MEPVRPAGDATLTGTGVILGTVDYLAPEQAQAASRADARSDLYSLGCTFYYLLTGKAVFGERSSLVEKVAAHAGEPPPSVRDLRPDVPRPIAAVVHKLLAKKPQDRYPSAEALVAALDAAMRPSLLDRWRVSLAAAAAVLLAAVALGGYLVFGPGCGGESAGITTPAPAAKPIPSLGLLDLLLQRKGQKTVRYALVTAGKDEAGGTLDPLRPKELVRLEGKFEAPVQWYLVWIDTSGDVSIQGRSAGPQAEIEVPPEDKKRQHRMLEFGNDPSGVHLLVLVAGQVPPPAGEELLKQSLAGIGRPPNVEDTPSWVRRLRAPQFAVAVPGSSPARYLRDLRERLPRGLELVYVFPLPGER
jgi:hypothetical protein